MKASLLHRHLRRMSWYCGCASEAEFPSWTHSLSTTPAFRDVPQIPFPLQVSAICCPTLKANGSGGRRPWSIRPHESFSCVCILGRRFQNLKRSFGTNGKRYSARSRSPRLLHRPTSAHPFFSETLPARAKCGRLGAACNFSSLAPSCAASTLHDSKKNNHQL